MLFPKPKSQPSQRAYTGIMFKSSGFGSSARSRIEFSASSPFQQTLNELSFQTKFTCLSSIILPPDPYPKALNCLSLKLLHGCVYTAFKALKFSYKGAFFMTSLIKRQPHEGQNPP